MEGQEIITSLIPSGITIGGALGVVAVWEFYKNKLNNKRNGNGKNIIDDKNGNNRNITDDKVKLMILEQQEKCCRMREEERKEMKISLERIHDRIDKLIETQKEK